MRKQAVGYVCFEFLLYFTIYSRPYFETKWKEYLEERRIAGNEDEPFFEPDFDVKARDAFYKKYSFSGWGGASGHDAPMIALVLNSMSSRLM